MKKMIRSITLLAGTLMIMLLFGCKEQTEKQVDLYPDMPSVLKSMQGNWEALQTNESCSAVFQGYTIRMRYQNSESDVLHKQNVSIDRVDTERSYLIINGGIGAWPYRISHTDREQLYLEFFTVDGWHNVQLVRTES